MIKEVATTRQPDDERSRDARRGVPQDHKYTTAAASAAQKVNPGTGRHERDGKNPKNSTRFSAVGTAHANRLPKLSGRE